MGRYVLSTILLFRKQKYCPVSDVADMGGNGLWPGLSEVLFRKQKYCPVSDNVGEWLVGRRIMVYWDGDEKWFAGMS